MRPWQPSSVVLGGTAILALACSSSPAIEGRVVDGYSGRPIAGHTLTLAGTKLTTISSEDGRYRFEEVASGLQRIEPMEGFVVPKALEVNVPEGEQIEAADLVVYELPQQPGLAVVHDGVVRALASAEERSYRGAGGPFTMGATYCCWLDLAVADTAPRVADGDLIVRALDREAAKTQPVEIFKVKREPPLLREYKDRRGRAYAKPDRLPERLMIDKTGHPLTFVPVSEGLWRFDPKALSPGLWVLRVRSSTSAFTATVTTYPFQVEASLAALDGELLRVDTGRYAGGSQQWTLAKDRVLTWCTAGGSPDCPTVVRALEDPTTSGSSPQCDAVFDVTSAKAELTSGECAAVGVEVIARFVRSGVGYTLEGVETRPLGGEEEGD